MPIAAGDIQRPQGQSSPRNGFFPDSQQHPGLGARKTSWEKLSPSLLTVSSAITDCPSLFYRQSPRKRAPKFASSQCSWIFPLCINSCLHPPQPRSGHEPRGPRSCRAALDPAAAERPQPRPAPRGCSARSGLWPGSSSGNCSLSASMAPADTAAFISCPEPWGGVTASC